MVCGAPASGKSTVTKTFTNKGAISLNRDTEGGTIAGLLPKMEKLLQDKKDIVLDNLFVNVEVRKPFIELAKKYNQDINCVLMSTSIEDAQFNVVQRAIKLIGKFPTPEAIKEAKHTNIFPPLVLFKYKKEFEKPTVAEGFAKVDTFKFVRQDDPTFTQKALILDYDGCLRHCIGGNGKFPTSKNHIKINEKSIKILSSYQENGYKLLGVSNQSGVHKGDITYNTAVELFDYTNQLLGLNIDYRFCPHQSNPISCYCRKPQVGFGVEFIIKYKLNRKECYFIGDMTTDQTFSNRCGFQYIDQADFYK